MGQTSKVEYKGNLRTIAVHLKSNNEIITDAPTDNNGKGEAFSPTDLVATSLASCMLTIMGIRAQSLNVVLSGASVQVEKIMASGPRRIAEIVLHLDLRSSTANEKERQILEAAARSCPVALTIHPETTQTVHFKW